jgi:hypothetical protein
VSIEPNTTASTSTTETAPVSAIENEIPTYRAISPGAVVSLICGVLAVLSFANWGFLLFAAAAIVIGVLADRKIVRLSDVLTGRGIAQAGIALGLSFGLAAITTSVVQSWLRLRAAETFAKRYETVLNKGTIEDAAWWGQAPHIRKGKTPQDLYAEMKKPGPGGSMLDMTLGPLNKLKAQLSDGKADIDFVKVEQHGRDQLDAYAAALYELHPHGSNSIPEGEQFALALLRGRPTDKAYEWFVENLEYPYKPSSYRPVSKPVDDGHGHAH